MLKTMEEEADTAKEAPDDAAESDATAGNLELPLSGTSSSPKSTASVESETF
jgi:hypothetical protein